MNNLWQQRHWVALVLILALGALHVMYYVPHITDDAYISLRYAHRLLEGKGLTWNDGERVEGYSDLLWVLLSAGLGAIGFTLEYAPMALGIVCLVLTIPALFYYAHRTQLPVWITLAGLALFLASPPVAVWTTADLETPMVMFCYSWALVLSYNLLTRKAVLRLRKDSKLVNP